MVFVGFDSLHAQSAIVPYNNNQINIRKNEVIKMKKNTVKTKIGMLDFSRLDLMDDVIEMYVGISEISEDIKETVGKAVEEAKIQHKEDLYVKAHNYSYSAKGVTLNPQLHITLKGNHVSYDLYIFIEDVENEDLVTSAYIPIDLTEHEHEMKKVIMMSLMDKFF